ncbi:MAG: hypothetical protein HY717_12640 [Planctomycetes bacterium]|nr:hypothetical protein [Planctomycetota bacterium]
MDKNDLRDVILRNLRELLDIHPLECERAAARIAEEIVELEARKRTAAERRLLAEDHLLRR